MNQAPTPDKSGLYIINKVGLMNQAPTQDIKSLHKINQAPTE